MLLLLALIACPRPAVPVAEVPVFAEQLVCHGPPGELLADLEATLAHNGWEPAAEAPAWPRRGATLRVGSGDGVLAVESTGRWVAEPHAPGRRGSWPQGLTGLAGAAVDLGAPCQVEVVRREPTGGLVRLHWDLPGDWGALPPVLEADAVELPEVEDIAWTERSYAMRVVDGRDPGADAAIEALLDGAGAAADWPGVFHLVKARREPWLRLWWACEDLDRLVPGRPACPGLEPPALADPLAGDVVLGEHAVARAVPLLLAPRTIEANALCRVRRVVELSPEVRERLSGASR